MFMTQSMQITFSLQVREGRFVQLSVGYDGIYIKHDAPKTAAQISEMEALRNAMFYTSKQFQQKSVSPDLPLNMLQPYLIGIITSKSITKKGIVQHCLLSEPCVREFPIDNCAATRELSRPRLKRKKLDFANTGRSPTKL